jgi:hypothetical protein
LALAGLRPEFEGFQEFKKSRGLRIRWTYASRKRLTSSKTIICCFVSAWQYPEFEGFQEFRKSRKLVSDGCRLLRNG